MEEDTSGVSQAFSLPNGGGSERNREGFGSKDVEEVKSCGRRITGDFFFFALSCLGKIPGGAPFSQLHKTGNGSRVDRP